MRFQDQKLQALVNAAKEATVAVDAVEVDAAIYAELEENERVTHAALVDYCLSLMPKTISKEVENSRLFKSKLIDKYVFSQI
jgi:hypothetical protein